jgi:hypothetical protein
MRRRQTRIKQPAARGSTMKEKRTTAVKNGRLQLAQLCSDLGLQLIWYHLAERSCRLRLARLVVLMEATS